MSKQAMLHGKVTPSQDNTAPEQNNTNIRPDPGGFSVGFPTELGQPSAKVTVET